MIDANNGAQSAVCVSTAVSGKGKNGRQLMVPCGGSITGVETSDGGTVSRASITAHSDIYGPLRSERLTGHGPDPVLIIASGHGHAVA